MTKQKKVIAPQLEARVSQWIATLEGSGSRLTITALQGDGSTRRFFRVASNQQTYLLLWDAAWITTRDYAPHQRLLLEAGIPVPHFYDWDSKLGILLMEDLGDALLQQVIQKGDISLEAGLDEAVKVLARLHAALYPVPAAAPAASRFFDSEKYFQELCFTVEHLRCGLLEQAPLSSQEEQAVASFCKNLAKLKPIVFCHRDYHTRNILWFHSGPYLIDFQDARSGPPHYDLASLLYDAYLPISEKVREERLVTYENEMATTALAKAVDKATFRAQLRQCALQRTLKAAGSFASFYTRYQKSTHLPYLAPCLRMVDELFDQTETESEFRTAFPVKTWLKKVARFEEN